MAVPLILSDVPNKTPYIQYVATNGQTVFPYPFPITQDSDLIVVPNGVPLNTDTGYTLSGQGNDTGGNVTFTLGRTAGDIITLYRDIAIQRLSQIAQNSGFSSTVFNAEFNNLYLIAQQLKAASAQFLQIPNTNNPAPTTILTAANYANKYLSFDVNGNPIPAVLTSSGTITTAILAPFFNLQRTQAEINAGVVPANLGYQPLDPRRYNAVLDGTADDTTALNAWVAVINASTNPVSRWPTGAKGLCQPLNAITAANLTLTDAYFLVKANSWPTIAPQVLHVPFNGTGLRLTNVTVDGNQANFSGSAPFGYLASFAGNNFKQSGCQFINSPGGIVTFSSVSNGKSSNCSFDGNVNSIVISQSSHLSFVNCTNNLNGYPFPYNASNPGVAQSGGFGMAIRYRSHHITFTGCEFNQNCLDGANVNQGSYAIKFIGCTGWMNGDGGFTIAADNTSTGLPGEGESCYDLEYTDCESYNNWGSGLVANAPVFNISVDGGRYYNNQRSAGILAAASSAGNGLFIAGHSFGVNIKTKSYDDRQLRVITASNGAGVLTATNWGISATTSQFVATATYYPRVKLFNAQMMFQGFGTIAAESSGSVTITSTAFNGVTLGNIASGWFVSQRVQDNGCFTDNGSIGSVEVDGFGFLQGVVGTLTGYKILSGSLANGQNISLPGVPLDTTELMVNPGFEGGVTNWTFNLPGGGAAVTNSLFLPAASASQTVANPGVFTTATQAWTAGTPVVITGTAPGGFIAGQLYYIAAAGLTTTAVELAATPGGTGLPCTASAACTIVPQNARSVASLAILGGSSAATGDATMITDALNFTCPNGWVETGMWVFAVNAGDAQFVLVWNSAGTGQLTSAVDHPGGGWKLLKISAFLPSQLTGMNSRVQVQPNKFAWFDTGYCRAKTPSYDERDFTYPQRNLPY